MTIAQGPPGCAGTRVLSRRTVRHHQWVTCLALAGVEWRADRDPTGLTPFPSPGARTTITGPPRSPCPTTPRAQACSLHLAVRGVVCTGATRALFYTLIVRIGPARARPRVLPVTPLRGRVWRHVPVRENHAEFGRRGYPPAS